VTVSLHPKLTLYAALGAAGALTATYGVAVERMLRPKITRYDVQPARWPADPPS